MCYQLVSSQCNENILHLLPKMRKAGDEIIMSLQRNFWTPISPGKVTGNPFIRNSLPYYKNLKMFYFKRQYTFYMIRNG